MPCNPNAIIAALHEEKQLVNDITTERIETSDRMALRKIPDGGVIARNANSESIIYGESQQASMEYRRLNHDPRDLVDGATPGRKLDGTNGLFDTQNNEIDDNACHGSCTIDFGQGYRRRGYYDFELPVDTPIKCARELDRLGESHIRGYFNGWKNQFSRWGYDNYSDNLLNLVIRYGEANASILGPDQFQLTAGGWQAPPQYRISIHFLQDYREQIMANSEALGFTLAEDYMLEVEMPREDWIEAVKADQISRIGMAGASTYDVKIFEDVEGVMRGRKMSEYGGIRCYFNERPIRGYFRQVGVDGDGNPVHRFTRVYHWKNNAGEEAGLVLVKNDDYRRDTIRVNGVDYPVITLIPHIHPKSFTRHGLMKPIRPDGRNSGVNYQVEVLDGAHIPGNDYNDKFKLVARHEFRFKVKYPELSGFIAYRHGRRTGYVIEVTPRDYNGGPNELATAEEYRRCSTDPVSEANCAVCDELVGPDLQCVASENAEEGIVNLDPCGGVNTAFYGDNFTLQVSVRRSGDVTLPASVDYATAAYGAPTSVTGVYTPVTGTLEWEAGDSSVKYVSIPITGASGIEDLDYQFQLELSNPDGVELGCDATVITVADLSLD
jgi:hypothetical protein